MLVWEGGEGECEGMCVREEGVTGCIVTVCERVGMRR